MIYCWYFITEKKKKELTRRLLDLYFRVGGLRFSGRLPLNQIKFSQHAHTGFNKVPTETCTLLTDSPGFFPLDLVKSTSAYTTSAAVILLLRLDVASRVDFAPSSEKKKEERKKTSCLLFTVV